MLWRKLRALMPRCARSLLSLLALLGAIACSIDDRTLQAGSGSSSTSAGESGAGDGSGNAPGEGPGNASGSGSGGSSGGSEGGAPTSAPECGNGVVEAGEGCDDGGVADHDGCDSACELEPSFECSGEPSACRSCSGEAGERRCVIAGGPFVLGAEPESVPAAVSSFAFDELEVTVARFRKYVASFTGPPAAGSGQHPDVPESGWRSEWNVSFPDTRDALLEDLHCNAQWETWIDQPGATEQLPITCVSYYTAFAFCAWAGGRLATEAEWEYAATGGAQQRLYPWGDAVPSATLAVYETLGVEAVGSRKPGMARFGQLDLAGSVWEWSLDLYGSLPASCDRCAEVEQGVSRVLRGGDWLGEPEFLKASYRFSADPSLSLGNVGIRCAYDLD